MTVTNGPSEEEGKLRPVGEKECGVQHAKTDCERTAGAAGSGCNEWNGPANDEGSRKKAGSPKIGCTDEADGEMNQKKESKKESRGEVRENITSAPRRCPQRRGASANESKPNGVPWRTSDGARMCSGLLPFQRYDPGWTQALQSN